MKLSAKVLVIGGGPAGATAAKFLAERGIDVILIERNLSFVKPCGGGLSIGAFDELGISKAAIKKEVKKIRLVSPLGERVDIALTGSSLAIIERGDFDRTLRNVAESRGVKIIEGEFTGIQCDKYPKVQINRGEDTCEIVSDYVIAADGVNSRVRTALGIKPSRSFFTASEHIKGIDTECCEFWFGSFHAPYSYAWVFPASEGVSIGTGCFEPGKINALFERFRKRTGIFSEGKKRIYRVPVWKGDLYNRGKILFAGDSAGQVLPLTYEGIYYAMRAGELAALAIIEEKVNNYKKMWKDRFQKRFMLMDKLRNYFLKDDASAEKLVAYHKRPEIQEASLHLWLRKDSSRESFMNYLRLFRKSLL
jgi:geranylgeranyl reductase